jgi:lipoyl(octanoyl) transferase
MSAGGQDAAPAAPAAGVRPLQLVRLGRIPYGEGLTRMEALVEARARGQAPDTLLLLEHEHVVTLGRGASPTNVVASDAHREALGVELFRTGRGGDVTYHGPGQVVGYPIVDLKPDRCDVRRYVHDLEEAMLRAAVDLGVPAERLGRMPGMTGLWVDPGTERTAKIGAIGVRISRWITSHGFAFNVATDLRYFDLIVPCGIRQHGVTSLERLLPGAPPLAEVETRLAAHLADLLGRQLTG